MIHQLSGINFDQKYRHTHEIRDVTAYSYFRDSAKDALEDALALEKDVHNKIYRLHGIAEHQCRDPHLMDFLETPFLEEQVQSIGQLNRLISIIREMDNGMGEYLLDRQILRGETKTDDL